MTSNPYAIVECIDGVSEEPVSIRNWPPPSSKNLAPSQAVVQPFFRTNNDHVVLKREDFQSSEKPPHQIVNPWSKASAPMIRKEEVTLPKGDKYPHPLKYDNLAQSSSANKPLVAQKPKPQFHNNPQTSRLLDDRFVINLKDRRLHNPESEYDTVQTGLLEKLCTPCRWLQPQPDHRCVAYFAWIELIIGLICLTIAIVIVCLSKLRLYTPLHHPCWTTPIFVINGILGVACASSRRKLFASHLILSVLCVVASAILITLNIIDWEKIGFETKVDCLMPKYEFELFKRFHHYKPASKVDEDLLECTIYLKWALTLNVTLVILAVFEAFLNLASTIMCTMRLGECRRRFGMNNNYN